MLEERRLEVLRAIVEDFVLTNEPVGSKALADRHQLGVSPATVRNDMAALEDEGYIAQPHTSAGRIPTDLGYRLFVDRLSSVKPLSVAERRAIESFLEGAVDLDDVVRRSVRLLAQITRQVAVVQYPSLSRSAVRHVEIVAMTPSRILLVLITDKGRVEQRVVEVPHGVSDIDVADLRRLLGQALHGRRLVDVPAALAELPDAAPPPIRPYVSALATVVLEALVERPEERVVLAGTANLTGSDGSALDFPFSLRPVLEALEEQVVLLRLLGHAADPDTVTVRIGHENDVEGLQSTSVISAGYGFGGMGVLGPTRMDYPATMAAVRAVARYVGELLGTS
ncbi:MAG: heat-inducible transcriptional repressor [Frankiaceae bacterium]|jgi:heat-inducible transcriptional repressor|nr:heat-inducible transcriptional repressor [Frankiaceae bacterium]MDQ1634248.1 heat-inducible transcriptional repressor [Frankiaceae bacterium]MDQ1649861.1 heat-inducible transcriptional repressor [Frankiaceae bacterium]